MRFGDMPTITNWFAEFGLRFSLEVPLLAGRNLFKMRDCSGFKNTFEKEALWTPGHDLVLMFRIFYWRQRFLLFSFIVQQGVAINPTIAKATGLN